MRSLRYIRNNVLYIFLLLFICLPINAQKDISELQGKELKNRVRLNFIPVSMPNNTSFTEPTMGLMGLHYQIPFNDWLYGGAAFHFAVTGDQGGLFTLGAELGVNKKIIDNLYFDANFHFGGGGGYRILVNDGAFINPNAGLQYKKNDYGFGIQYSHINFYTGSIKDNAISFFVEIPSIFRFSDYKDANQIVKLGNTEDYFWKKPSVKNVQQVRFDFFFPFGNSKRDNDTQLDNTLYVLGFEYQKYLNDKTFIFAHTDAIYKGLRAGFMDLFFGAGYHPYQSKYINLFGKLAIGAAGGRIAPEGGLTAYPSAGIDINLSDHLALSGHGGYYRALDGDFEAYTLGFGLKYKNLSGGTDNASEQSNSEFKTQGISISIQNQTYFKVNKTDDPSGVLITDLQLLGFQFNYDIFKNVYVIGEAGFAYGGRSGGYAHGVVGLGVKTNTLFNNKLNLFANFTGGAAGGAGVDSGEGIIIRPTVGFNYFATDNLALKVSGGKLYAPFGNVNSNNINVGLSFNFASLLKK
ncbi:hypothetical protein [Tenacibaculum agarivorans]|uniref:hypothetical protein n=1 Tax=Tenacibaculum agarivorans TaxID=1908389 RepID=UPI00094BBB7D|nr:hypothetical protein [Tenacibaculum agarivorans]